MDIMSYTTEQGGKKKYFWFCGMKYTFVTEIYIAVLWSGYS